MAGRGIMKPTWFVTIAVVFLGIGLGTILSDRNRLPSLSPAGVAPLPMPALQPGARAPDFRLPILSEDLVRGAPDSLSLSSLRGRYVVVSFWATWCVPCRTEYPELVALEREMRDRGVAVLGVLHQDPVQSALDFESDQSAGTFTTVVDARERVASDYRVGGIPKTLVLDREGRIIESFSGWGPGAVARIRNRIESEMAREGR